MLAFQSAAGVGPGRVRSLGAFQKGFTRVSIRGRGRPRPSLSPRTPGGGNSGFQSAAGVGPGRVVDTDRGRTHTRGRFNPRPGSAPAESHLDGRLPLPLEFQSAAGVGPGRVHLPRVPPADADVFQSAAGGRPRPSRATTWTASPSSGSFNPRPGSAPAESTWSISSTWTRRGFNPRPGSAPAESVADATVGLTFHDGFNPRPGSAPAESAGGGRGVRFAAVSIRGRGRPRPSPSASSNSR